MTAPSALHELPHTHLEPVLAEHDPESETATRVDHHDPSATPPPTKIKSEPVLTDQTNLLPFKQVVIVFVSLSFCTVVSALDSVIVATSLSTVGSHFNAGSVISWVPSAYLMTSTAFQPLYGRFSDIFGRKSAMGLAMAVYMIGNLIAGFSNSIIQVIVFRGVAGAGGGGIIGMMQIIVSDIITLRERGKYQGIIGGVVAIGYTVGPIIGGVLAQKVSWRVSIFQMSSAVSFFDDSSIVVFLDNTPPFTFCYHSSNDRTAFETSGGGYEKGGVTFPWTSAIVLAPLFCGILVVGIFCLWEWKGAKLPIIPMYIFKHQTVTGVYITMFVNGFAFFSAVYYIPQFFQVALGYTPLRAGLFLIPVVISQMAASWIAGLTVSRTGRYRTIVYTGFGILSIASGCISTFSEGSSRAAMVVLMLLCGWGSGMTMQTTTVAAQASVARKDMSVVTAVRNFLRMLGGAVSLPVASSLVNNALRSSMTPFSFSSSVISAVIDDPTLLGNSTRASALGISQDQSHSILTQGYTKGFSHLFILNGCLAAVATIVAYTMIKHKELTRGDENELREKAKREFEEREERHKFKKSHSYRKDSGDKSIPASGTATPHGKNDTASVNVDLEMGDMKNEQQ
ncbi:hypothetical protein VKT23_017469 [Stygiomarasmius scandens]|uniref:Major facilitator superfamily (MFS) profile domain-containing protein n=1 Tax=Marasmiellus scandens TaxID=2682957 RepID=A0ABR1IW96_9AGAR